MAQDLVPCILVSFDKEQIIVWWGKEDGILRDQTQRSSSSVFDSDVALVKNETVIKTCYSTDSEVISFDQYCTKMLFLLSR